MKDENKTKKQLIDELLELRQRITKLEKSRARHKRAKKVLKENEKTSRTLVEAFPDAIIVMDLNCNIIMVNEPGLKLFGYESAEEVIGKSALDFIAQKDLPRAVEDIKKMLETGIARNVEYTMLKKDGVSFPAELGGSLIVDERKKPKAFVVMARDITERKRLENILKKEQQELKLIIDSSPIIVFYKDKEGKFIRVNKAFAEALKMPEEEFVGKTVFDLYSATIAQGMTNDDQEVLKSGLPKLNIIEQYESASGIRWVQTDKIPICDKNGIPVGLIGFAQDITERKQAEEALIQAHRDWEEIFQAIGHPTLILDPEHNILLANRAAVNATGRTEDELKGKKCYEIFHGTDKPPKNCPLEKMLRSGRLEVFEMEIEALGGIFLVSCTPVFDDQGNVQRVIHIATDITERKRAEESLKKIEQKLRYIIEHSNEIFYIHDTHHRFTYVSPQSLFILGYAPDEMMIEWTNLVTDNPINIKGIEITEKALNTGERQKPYLLETYKKDGSKVLLEIDESPLKDADGKVIGIVGAARDITDRKQAEEELRSSREQLRAYATRLQAVREEERTLVAREIHDELGQALTALKMDLSWLKKRFPENQKLLFEKTESMSELIDKTIKTMKRISTELRPGLLDDLGIAAAVEWQAEEFQNRTGITCNVTIDPADIILDKDRSTAIFRIFQETLTNVSRHANATEVKASLMEKEGNLELKVTDNGKGITEEQISNPKSFGLIGIRERVYPYGGKVKIRGTPGKGTTVKVVIKL